MCGRFTLRTPPAELAEFFGLFREPDVRPRFNISPTQSVGAIRFDQDKTPREWVTLRWGLIPSWAKDAKIGNRLINARSESVAEKPAFRAAFKRRRCLIPADGFYEWKKLDAKTKQPYHITLPDGGPFAFAGLWEHWTAPDGGEVESCTIVTTEANEQMEELHDRMPVILSRENYDQWLNPGIQDREALEPLLRSCGDELRFTAVSTVVNSPRNESAECIAPATRQGRLY